MELLELCRRCEMNVCDEPDQITTNIWVRGKVVRVDDKLEALMNTAYKKSMLCYNQTNLMTLGSLAAIT